MKTRPHIVIVVMIYALALLSIAAGLPKILQMPQELDFLRSIGLSPVGVSMLGALQVTGGLLLFWKKYRLFGAVVAGLAFLTSSIAIFVGGDTSFGFISLLPVVASVIVIGGLLMWAGHSDAEEGH